MREKADGNGLRGDFMQTVKAKKKYTLFTGKQLLWLIAPIVIESIFTTSLGFFDSAMVSRIDPAGNAGNAVSNVDQINNLIIQLFSAFATGGAIITSQYLGARDSENANKSARQMVMLVLLLSVLIAAVCLVLNAPLLDLFFSDVKAESPVTYQYERDYFYITAASFPFIGLFNGCAALLRAQRKSMFTMVSAAISCFVNIGLNALFIWGFNMEVMGAALATLIARAIPAVYMLILLSNKKYLVHIGIGDLLLHLVTFRFDGRMIKKILYIAIPSGIESCLFQLGKLLTFRFVNAGCYVQQVTIGGTVETVNIQANANSIANGINNYASVVGSGIGTASLTVIGQAVGAGDIDQVKYYIKKMFAISFIANAIAVGAFMGTAQWVMYIYEYPEAAYSEALRCLYLCLSFQFVTYPLSFTTPAILKATSDVKYVMWSAIISMIVLRVGVCFVLVDDTLSPLFEDLFGFKFELGAFGFWIAMCADWVGRSVLFMSRLLTGRWKKASGLIAEDAGDRMSASAQKQRIKRGKKIVYLPYINRHAKKFAAK